MKKLFYLSVLFLITSAILSGCCLKHTWTDATCDNPMTCSKCGETEGDALGHNMSIPVILNTETMERTCTTCGTVFTDPLDINLVITEQFEGKWIAEENDYLLVNNDGTLSYTISGESGTGTWMIKDSILLKDSYVQEKLQDGGVVLIGAAQLQLTLNGSDAFSILSIPYDGIADSLQLVAATNIINMKRE